MLYLDSPILFLNGLQIHRDFQDPNQFYYFPAAPRIHRDLETGELAFKLLKYARDVTDNPRFSAEARDQVGGGFLTMTVDIGVDEEVLKDARRKLSAYASGTVQLAPVPFHTGAVRLVALDAPDGAAGDAAAQPRSIFVEKIYGSTKPSLYGDNLALLGASLSQEGATLLEKSFRDGGGLIGVVYDLTYAGVRPAIEVKAEVDFERVYNSIDAKIGFQYAMISAELEATLEFLREQGAIKIEITQFDTEPAAATALRTEAMELIKNEVIAKFLKPSLQVPARGSSSANPLESVVRLSRALAQPPRPNQGGGTPAPTQETPARPTSSEGERGPRSMNGANTGSGGATGGGPSQGGTPGFALSFSLKFVHQEERKRATLDFRVNQAVNRTAAPQGSFKFLRDQLTGDAIDSLITEVDLNDPFFNELRAHIGVTGNWAELGIERMVVNATYQPDPAGPVVHTDGWTFNAPGDPAKLFNVLIPKTFPTRRYKYKTQVFLKDASHIDAKERVLEIESESEQRELNIHPANEFAPLLISVEAGVIDWTKTRQVDVILKYEDANHDFGCGQLFSFRNGDSAKKSWVVYPVDRTRRSYSVQYRYQLADENNTIFTLDPVDQTDEGIVAPGPFRGSRRVRIAPALDREDVRDATVEVMYVKKGYRFYSAKTLEGDNWSAFSLDIPLPDPDPQRDTWKVRWSLTKMDWQVTEFPWREVSAPQFVISDGVHSVENVSVAFTRSVEEAGLSSLLLTVESLDPDGLVLDTENVRLTGSAAVTSMELRTLQGNPLRYRYRMQKNRGASSETVDPVERTERSITVQL